MRAFPKPGVQRSLVKMWLSSGESSPRFLGFAGLSRSIVVGQADNNSLGCSHAKAVVWLQQGPGTPLWAWSLDHMVSVSGGPWKGDHRPGPGPGTWGHGGTVTNRMSLYIHTANQTCSSKEKPNPAKRNQEENPFPKTVSLLRPLLIKHCVMFTEKEKCLLVQFIANQVLKDEFVTEKQYIDKCPMETDLFSLSRMWWRHTPWVCVPVVYHC